MRSQCPFCTCSFETEALEIIHLHEKHSEVEASFECQFCPRNFRFSYQLRNHMRSKGEKHKKTTWVKPEQKTPTCSLCDKVLRSESSVYPHMRDVHATQFMCKLCGSNFDKQNQLRLHCKIEHNGKVYRCSDCSHTFARAKTLKRHVFFKNRCKPIPE